MKREAMKVGELAKRTGLSVRTLHYYDEIGLLAPSTGGGSAGGGHRIYGPREIARLQQICSLRALGWSLEEIKRGIDDPQFSPLEVIEQHVRRLDAEVEVARKLRERLDGLALSLRGAEEPDVETLLETIDFMHTIEKYYSEEQLEQLRERRAKVGEERIRAVQDEWTQLFGEFRAAMERGDDPSAPAVLDLARRARDLIDEFTGGDAAIGASLGNMYANEPEMTTRVGADPALFEYMGRARRALES